MLPPARISMEFHIVDWAQFASIAGTLIAGVIGYGRLQERVANHEKELAERVTKDSMEPFQNEVLRRLKRIESKQDKANGK